MHVALNTQQNETNHTYIATNGGLCETNRKNNAHGIKNKKKQWKTNETHIAANGGLPAKAIKSLCT